MFPGKHQLGRVRRVCLLDTVSSSGLQNTSLPPKTGGTKPIQLLVLLRSPEFRVTILCPMVSLGLVTMN